MTGHESCSGTTCRAFRTRLAFASPYRGDAPNDADWLPRTIRSLVGGSSMLTPSPALSSGCAQASSSTMGTSMRVHFSMARNASSALAGLREALVCDATYVHDHARGRFSSVDTFERDHRSIVLYFERFRLAGPVGLALLRLCTALGSAEYRIACSIHGFLNRDPAAKEPCGGAA